MKPVIIFLLSVCLLTCKNKEKNPGIVSEKAPEPNVQEIKAPAPVMGKLDDAFIKLADAQQDVPDLVDEIWHYTFGLSLKDPTPKENIFKGQWLDLLPKGHYKKGLYKETTEDGRYIYDEKTTLLEMRSTSGTSSEWKVKVDPSHMILIGTSKYGNNPWQIKLSRRDSLPEIKG
jgi:hypothetical protein